MRYALGEVSARGSGGDLRDFKDYLPEAGLFLFRLVLFLPMAGKKT